MSHRGAGRQRSIYVYMRCICMIIQLKISTYTTYDDEIILTIKNSTI